MITTHRSTFGDGSILGIHDNTAHMVLVIDAIRMPAVGSRTAFALTPDEAHKLAAALIRHADGIAPEMEGNGNG